MVSGGILSCWLHFFVFPGVSPEIQDGFSFKVDCALFSRRNPPDTPPVSFRISTGIHPLAWIPGGFLVDPGGIFLPVKLYRFTCLDLPCYPAPEHGNKYI